MANELKYRSYEGEQDLDLLNLLIAKELSEPYSVYTYRYFCNNWPDLTILGFDPAVKQEDGSDKPVCVIVCKLAKDKQERMRGYIAMLAVDSTYRKRGIASHLVLMALQRMKDAGGDLCVLETEITNTGALGLYQKLNFVRDKRLAKYYLNGVDAFRLKYWITKPVITTAVDESLRVSQNDEKQEDGAEGPAQAATTPSEEPSA